MRQTFYWRNTAYTEEVFSLQVHASLVNAVFWIFCFHYVQPVAHSESITFAFIKKPCLFKGGHVHSRTCLDITILYCNPTCQPNSHTADIHKTLYKVYFLPFLDHVLMCSHGGANWFERNHHQLVCILDSHKGRCGIFASHNRIYSMYLKIRSVSPSLPFFSPWTADPKKWRRNRN